MKSINKNLFIIVTLLTIIFSVPTYAGFKPSRFIRNTARNIGRAGEAIITLGNSERQRKEREEAAAKHEAAQQAQIALLREQNQTLQQEIEVLEQNNDDTGSVNDTEDEEEQKEENEERKQEEEKEQIRIQGQITQYLLFLRPIKAIIPSIELMDEVVELMKASIEFISPESTLKYLGSIKGVLEEASKVDAKNKASIEIAKEEIKSLIFDIEQEKEFRNQLKTQLDRLVTTNDSIKKSISDQAAGFKVQVEALIKQITDPLKQQAYTSELNDIFSYRITTF